MELKRIDAVDGVEFRYMLGNEMIYAKVYHGDDCAVLRCIGPRGGLRGMITVPKNVLSELLYVIQVEDE